MKVEIVLENGVKIPEYATAGSAGMDLRANISKSVILDAGKRTLIPTGIKIKIPEGYEMQIRPRSGLALNIGITVLNAPATIDSDFRGELKVILINHGDSAFEIKPQERVAQMVLKKVEKCEFEVVFDLDSTQRAAGGFGSSGRI